MIYSELTKTAATICVSAHAGQSDRGGYPYCMHPIHLAEQMSDEESCAAALLHDVIEDCGYTFDQLREAGITEPVIQALRLLTHDPSVDYMVYVEAISHNPIARKVKMADLRHNLEPSRMPGAEPFRKWPLYRQALEFLESVDR